MKDLHKNKGFTLVELIVSIAILAFIMIAIIGMMYSNNVIFRKTKSDINLQNIAQDTYSKISSDVMQAKNICLEGYVPGNIDNKIVFSPTDIGGSTAISVSRGQYLKQSDINLKKDKNPTEAYITYMNTVSQYDVDTMISKKNTVSSHAIDSYYYNIRYMDSTEKGAYANFFVKCDAVVGNPSSFAPYESLKVSQPTGSDPKYKLYDIYLKRMIISYSVPVDNKYCSTATTEEFDNLIVIYEFNKNEMTVTSQYTYMDKLNGSQIYTDKLNYVNDGTNDITGVVARVDSENNALGFTMYFAKESMNYTLEGVVGIRNSFVLNDAQ